MRGFMPFPNGNIIALLEFELIYYNISVQYVSHDATRTLPDKWYYTIWYYNDIIMVLYCIDYNSFLLLLGIVY